MSDFIFKSIENMLQKDILNILLFDRTTKRNIIWATNEYQYLGDGYNQYEQIKIKNIIQNNSDVIQPRVYKSKEKQLKRTKEKAEVFTPSWVCNTQNNLIDNAWFNRKNVFNIEKEKSWQTKKSKIKFPDNKNKTWQKYVDERRIEITCGEAPYLVSRYDTVSGEFINLKDRIGMLDRKMRIVKENTKGEKEWLKWSQRAFESVYGFEFQGDSLFIARKNLLLSYCDYMQDALKREPTHKELLVIARIISWNLWQMDGLTFQIPFEDKANGIEQSLFDFLDEKSKFFCIIKDWRAKKILTFKSLIDKGKK